MRHTRVVRIAVAAAVAIAALLVAGVASAATITKNIPSAGTIAVPNAPAPQAGVSGGLPEIDSSTLDADPLAQGATVNRGNSGGRFDHHGRHGDRHQNANPKLLQSFDGLNFFDQRFANGGNQFSVEPPDQGLCVGNGKVVEIVNDVYQVFDTRGHALTNPIDVNSLFGYPAAINRSTGAYGPDVFDMSCLYDSQTRTFFVLGSVLDRVGTTSALSGTSHVDIGVAKDPTSSYTFYRIDTTNDSPLCTLDGTTPGPCFPDYPHAGADRNGFYVTTNVFDFFGPNFDGVNIYALPKFKLASGASSVPVTIVSTNGQGPSGPDGGTGFALIPAVTPDDQFNGAGGGTENFVSSRAVFTDDGTASSIVAWSLSNTRSLLWSTPDLQLTFSIVNTDVYGIPAPPTQKPGDVPLATCIGSTVQPPSVPLPCWRAVGLFPGPTTVAENVLDPLDSRIGGVSYANGKLWAVLGSAATDSSGNPVDGAAWFVMNPHGMTTGLINQGMLLKDGSNLTLPSIAATSNGDAAMGFTIVGPNDYPSAGYAGLDARSGAGDPQYAKKGAGPQDGFTEYQPFFSDGSPRPRWGDYGAAVADGPSIWVASEYIGQTCTFNQYLQPSPTNVAAFGTCGDTRGALGNWDTRISQLLPGGSYH